MRSNANTIGTFMWRITATHVITYFIVGILAMSLFNYEGLFSSGNLASFMKPVDSPWVALGPGLQVFRGLIFALVLWPFKSIFLDEKYGWIKLWLLFIGLGILSTFGPALGSIDGLIYTTVPIQDQLVFLPELLCQSFLLSFFIFYWYRTPKKLFTVLSIILLVLILLMSIAGFLSLNH